MELLQISRQMLKLVMIQSWLCLVLTSSAVWAQEVSWPVQWLDRQSVEKGELLWNKPSNRWELRQADGQMIKLGEVQAVESRRVQSPRRLIGEFPNRIIAILSYQERLTGDLFGLKPGRNLVMTNQRGDRLTLPLNSVASWLLHPGLNSLLNEDFEGDPAATAAPTGFPPVNGSKVRELKGKLNLVLPESAPLTKALHVLQFAFLVEDHKQLSELVLKLYADRDAEDFQSLKIGYNSETGQFQTTSLKGPELPLGIVQLKPGWHWFTCEWRPDRTRVSIDDLVITEMKSSWFKLPMIDSLEFVETNPEAQSHWFIDSLGIYEYSHVEHPAQRLESTDLIQIAGGHEFFGEIQTLTPEKLVFLSETPVTLPTGQVRAILTRDEKKTGQWALGQVVKVTFSNPGRSLWSSDQNHAGLAKLGLVNPPPEGMDRVEGVLSELSQESLKLRLSQSGEEIQIHKDDMATINPIGASGVRVLDTRPHHLGDEVDMKVIPLEPEGNRLGIAFDSNETEANFKVSLAVDVLQVLGANIAPFVESIKRGELVTEVYLNDILIDNLNRHVLDRNEKPQRIMIEIPKGLVKAGKSTIEFRQKGQKNNPNYLDDLSILGVRLYRID